MKWSIIQMRMTNMIQSDATPIHHLMTKPLSIISLFTSLHDPSSDAWRCQGWRRICCRGDTLTPPPSLACTHVCKWWHERLMGPPCNPQPDICILSWCPPTDYKGVACWQGSLPLKLKGQLKRLILVPVHRTRSFRFLGLLRGWVEDGGRWGVADFLMRRWGWGHKGMQHCSPQEPIKTLHLWACHHHFHLFQATGLQMLCLYL